MKKFIVIFYTGAYLFAHTTLSERLEILYKNKERLGEQFYTTGYSNGRSFDIYQFGHINYEFQDNVVGSLYDFLRYGMNVIMKIEIRYLKFCKMIIV